MQTGSRGHGTNLFGKEISQSLLDSCARLGLAITNIMLEQKVAHLCATAGSSTDTENPNQ